MAAEEKPSSVALMSLNATKAGMEGLDKAAVNAIIEEASKGSKFYEAKAKAQKRIDAKKSAMLDKMKSFSGEAISSSEAKADKIIRELSATESDTSRVIVHVDMDAFYAAVEERDDPSLKDKPMAVGSTGMLSTSNYLARKFGVRAGMPGFIGKKLCPDLKIVPLNFDKYRAVSSVVRSVFNEYDPGFCPMSLDEAYLDITDYLLRHPILKPEDVVAEMRAKIQERTQLTASAGISYNSMLAKICSDYNKPNGQYVLLDVEEARKLIANLPVRKVGGIGNVTEQLLNAIGVVMCQDILTNRGLIFLLFSELSATSFYRIALGIGCTQIGEMANRERKSMSTETTFRDTSDPAKLRDICAELCAELASDLQAENLSGRQVTVKIKTHKFAVKTKVANLILPTCDVEKLTNTAMRVLNSFMETIEDKPLTLRLLGVRMSDFTEASSSCMSSAKGTIEQFFASSPNEALPAFECPLCNSRVQCRNEAAFNASHFEQCLASNETRNFLRQSDVTSSYDLINVEVGANPGKHSTAAVATLTSTSLQQNVFNPEAIIDNSSYSATGQEATSIASCPICDTSLHNNPDINGHIDQCLNKDTIDQLVREENSRKRKLDATNERNTVIKKTKNSIVAYFGKKPA